MSRPHSSTLSNGRQKHQLLRLGVLLLLARVGRGSAGGGGGGSSASSSRSGSSSSNSSSASSSQPPLCLGWAASCPAAHAGAPYFVLIGDSITSFGFNERGWAWRMAAAWQGSVSIVNQGVEGATTRRVDEIADRVLAQLGQDLSRVKLATVGFGANDAVTPHAPRWHLPLPQFTENLERLVQRLQAAGVEHVVLITPPPVGWRGDRKANWTRAYAEAVVSLAATLHAPAVDIFNAVMAADPKNWTRSAMDKDQLHLSDLGQQAVYEAVMAVVANISGLSPAAMAAAAAASQAQALRAAAAASAPSDDAGGQRAMQLILLGTLLVLFLRVVSESRAPPGGGAKAQGKPPFFPSLLRPRRDDVGGQ